MILAHPVLGANCQAAISSPIIVWGKIFRQRNNVTQPDQHKHPELLLCAQVARSAWQTLRRVECKENQVTPLQ
eukprot:1159516-Pelagomonas_calceolata.AAC.16